MTIKYKTIEYCVETDGLWVYVDNMKGDACIRQTRPSGKEDRVLVNADAIPELIEVLNEIRNEGK